MALAALLQNQHYEICPAIRTALLLTWPKPSCTKPFLAARRMDYEEGRAGMSLTFQ